VADDAAPATTPPPGGFSKKSLFWIGGITLAIWAFAVQTGSMILMIIVSVLTLLLLGVLLWAWRMIRKQRGMISLLQGATASADARKEAFDKLSADKDAGSPMKLFARAQLLAGDDPKGALKLLEGTELKTFPAAMQDDVSLLKAQIYLGSGRTQDARKCADVMNLDNPQRKDIRPLAATIVAEAWARTGKPKEALALLETIEIPKKDGEQIALQGRIAKVFAKFAMRQVQAARQEMVSLADDDVNNLGRFVAPQFKVHPELQKLARQVYEQHPSARRQVKTRQR
jgi:hypothetical protein